MIIICFSKVSFHATQNLHGTLDTFESVTKTTSIDFVIYITIDFISY